jgi:hypothetical protein
LRPPFHTSDSISSDYKNACRSVNIKTAILGNIKGTSKAEKNILRDDLCLISLSREGAILLVINNLSE